MATQNVNMSVTCANGAPVEVFQRLIAARVKELHETTEYATRACAIDALNSIRARTRKAQKKTAKEGLWAHSLKKVDSYYLSWGPGRRRVLRRGTRGSHGAIVTGVRVKWFNFRGGYRDSQLNVYMVTPVHQSVKPYYVVAYNIDGARWFETKCAEHRIKRYGGLARNTLGVAMAKISTRNVAMDGSDTCRVRSSALARVNETGGGFSSGSFGLYVETVIDYGIQALKNGKADISNALIAAANKIAGRITQAVKKSGFGEPFPTPFPEVRLK